MSNVLAHNAKAQSVWNSTGGRYDEISRTIADAIEHAVVRLDARSGERILDLSTGTGWASRAIARRTTGVKVIGADIAEHMLDYARATAAREELEIEYRHADAEQLPFADGEFDAVISTFGVMFVSQPEAAAREITRVLKPRGRVVLATWRPEGGLFQFFATMKKYMAAPASPSPFEWGKVARIEELFAAKFALTTEEATNVYRYASGEQAWQTWVNHYGPTKSLAASLDDTRREELHRDLVALHETFATPLGYAMQRPYLVTRGVGKSNGH